MSRAWTHLVVEGALDEAVARRLLDDHEIGITACIVTDGKPDLDSGLRDWNDSARQLPWIVIRDLDDDADCAPTWIARHVGTRNDRFHVRLAVREVEAWLLADADGLASCLGIDPVRVPSDPEAERDAKRRIVNLARSSRIRGVRTDVVPRDGTPNIVGPGYVQRMMSFAESRWNWRVAARKSRSLKGCLGAIRSIRSIR